VKIKRRTKMGIRKISLIIGIAIAILGLNYLLNLYNEKFVDVNSKDYIIEQFTKENIGNKKYFKQHGNVIGDKDYVILDDNNVEEYIYTTNNILLSIQFIIFVVMVWIEIYSASKIKGFL
jgi:hypothetical protein